MIRGNLIVVPVGDSLLYLQPVYLQSTSAAFPEFQRIVVASPTTVTWASTLGEALTTLLTAQGGAPTPTPAPTPGSGPTPTPGANATPAPTPPSGGGPAVGRRRPGRHTRTVTSSWPSRPCATATSPRTATRWTGCRWRSRRWAGSPAPRAPARSREPAGPALIRPGAAVTRPASDLDLAPSEVLLPRVPVRRLDWIAVIGGAFVSTLARPLAWAVGLAGFLAGGGILLVGIPIAVLPTPTGLQNSLGGPITTLVVGTPSTALIVLIAGVAAALVALVLAGVVAGAWAERQGIELALAAAADEEILGSAPDLAGAPGTLRVALVRLLSLIPVAVAAVAAWPALYDATYRELILPTDLASPLPVRVIRAVPGPLAAVAVTWLVSDAAAAAGVRHLVLERRPVAMAWLLGWTDLALRPLRILGTALAGAAVLAIVVIPVVLAAEAGWSRVRELMLAGGDPGGAMLAVVLWIAIWLGGLVLVGIAAAIRVAAWTLEAPRRS